MREFSLGVIFQLSALSKQKPQLFRQILKSWKSVDCIDSTEFSKVYFDVKNTFFELKKA